MSDLNAIRTLAARQHSVVDRRQCGALGVTPSQLTHYVASGALLQRGERVFVVAGAAPTDELDALVAALDAGGGAVVGGASALAWWRLPGFGLRHRGRIEVVRPHGPGLPSRAIAHIHVTRCLPDHHVTEHRGVPVLTPARAIFDAAAVLRAERLESVLEKAWAHHLVSGPVLHEMLDELATPGRRGIATMRRLLADRPPDHVPCESGLELRFARLLLEDGQAPMSRQADVGGSGWIGRVDFIDRAAKVIVEVQSLEHHGTARERAADAARIAALEAAGWTVIEATERDLWHAPGDLLRRVGAARRRGHARRAAA